MYERFEALLKERGLTGRQVALKAGVGTGTITDWKKGRYTPKRETLQKLADALDVPVELLTGEEVHDVYYEDPATAELAQRMKDDRDFRLLFSAAKDVSPETLQQTYDYLLYLKRKERGEE